MESIDASVLIIAMPMIAADLNTTPVELKLALTAFFVAVAMVVPLSGWLADRYGATRVIRVAIALFIVGSTACALAGDLAGLVAARFLQGVGAALMSPVARMMLVRLTPRQSLLSATSLFTVPTVVAPMFGPPLGGFLTTFVGWQSIFLINIPISLFALLALRLWLAPVPPRSAPPLDLAGFVCLSLGLSGLAFGLSMLSQTFAPVWLGPALVLLGIVGAVGYTRNARKAAHPLISLAIFRHRAFRISILSTSLMFLACGGLPLLTALMLQSGFGMSPLESGSLMLWGAVGALLAKALARRVFAWAGFRAGMGVAALLAATGIALKALLFPETPLYLMISLLFVNGTTRSVYFTGSAVLAVADVDEGDVGAATVTSILSRQLASALSLALLGFILSSLATAPGINTLGDLHAAYLVSALLALCAALVFLCARLSPLADVTGRR